MFVAYELTKEMISALRSVMPAIEARDRNLADQLRRAATSVLLNLAEGQKFANGNRRKHYEIAQGSANEVMAALDAAEAWGWIATRGPERAPIDRVLAVLWKLTRAPAIQNPRARTS